MINITIQDDETIVHESSVYILTPDGTIIDPTSSASRRSAFAHSFTSKDKLVKKVTKRDVTHYEAKDKTSAIRQQITAEVFEKLPEALSALYTSVVESKEVVEELADTVEVFNISEYVDSVSPEFTILSSEEVMRALLSYNFKNNKRAMIQIAKNYDRSEDGIEVTFFVNDYNGETRKIYDTKKNGQPYADGRGRFVHDYPKHAAKVHVPLRMIPSFSFETKEAYNISLQALHDHYTQFALLEGAK